MAEAHLVKEINLGNLKKLSLLLVYAIVAFYFLVNGEGTFEEWDASWTWTTIIYVLGVSIFLSIQEKLPKELESPIIKSIIGFLASFLLATILFTVVKDAGVYFVNVTPLPISQILPILVFQLCIVVISEEIIFRGVIFGYFFSQFNLIVGILVSATAFSLFHLAVYQGSIGALMTAFLMGLLFAYCVKIWNIGVAIGIHFAWNAFVIGATVLM